MANNARYLQAQSFSLAGSGCIGGATSITLNSMLQIDQVTPVTMADFGNKGFATIEPGNGTREEQVSFTSIVQNANGTATLSGVSTVLFAYPYTETSGTALSHPGGVTFVITNTSGFYNRFASTEDDQTIDGDWTFSAHSPTIPTEISSETHRAASIEYVNAIAISGSPDASDTVIGITKLSVAPASPTSPIAVGDNDTRVPPVNTSTLTSGEVQALVGNSGTPSSSNKYVTEAGLAIGLPSGLISMYGGASAPAGYLFCDGSSYLRATYANLFTAIGTTYGSADGTHFNVPDMRGRIPAGVGTGTGGGASGTGLPTGGSALTAVALSTWKGEETHTLITTEMPSHTHTTSYGNGSGGSLLEGGANSLLVSPASGSTGGDGPHNNIQPIMGVNFIIRT